MRTAAKKTLSLVLAVLLALGSMTVTPLTASAAEIQNNIPSITVGTDSGSPTVVGFDGHEWAVIGYDGDGVASESDTMTLLLKNDDTGGGYGATQFHDSSNHYSGSDLRSKMNDAYNGLSSGEKALVKSRDLEGESGNKGAGNYNDDNIAGETVTGAHFWPLSVNEANRLERNVLMYRNRWWLRTPGSDNIYAAAVGSLGGVDDTAGGGVEDEYAIRPAFHLDLTSVLFTSAAAGGKSDIGEGLVEAEEPDDAIKFTMLDTDTDNLDLTVSDTGAITKAAGETVEIEYTDAITGENKYISAVLTDGNGEVLYYGKLVDLETDGENGTASFEVPDDIDEGSYKIKLFNEECNGDNETDFASQPEEIALTVQENTPAPVTGPLVPGANLTGTQVYFGEYNGRSILWHTVAADSDTATLWTTTSMGNRKYDSSAHNNWSGSDICSWLNNAFFQNAFSTAEQNAIISEYSTSEEETNGFTITPAQAIVLPAYSEVIDSGIWGLTQIVRDHNDYWWLRSPGNGGNSVAVVDFNGFVSEVGGGVTSNIAVRPAFKLNLSSVLFASDAAGGKSDATVGDGLVAAEEPDSAVKLTVLDDAQTLNVLATAEQSTQEGSTLNFSYANATTGEKQYVSAVLADQNGEVKYYGKLAETDASDKAGGDLQIPLSDVEDGTYTLKIFSEQANGDNLTDFAGTPVSMTVEVSGSSGTVSDFDGTVLSNDAGLVSVAEQAIEAGSESGNSNDPKRAEIFVANNVSSITTADIVAATGASVSLYSDSGFSSAAASVSLSADSNNYLYIKVTAQDGVAVLYYDVTVVVQPRVIITPTALSFGRVRIGTSKTMTLTIDSSSPTVDNSYSFAGVNRSAFSIDDSGWDGASGTLQVTFTPTQTGGYHGAMTFSYRARITLSVAVSGTGYIDGDSSSNHNSSSSPTPTVAIPPAIQPDWPTIGSVSGKAAGTNTQTTFTVTDSLVKAALEQAQADAKARNRSAYGVGVSLALDTPAAAGMTFTLERAALNRLVSAGAKQFELTGAPISLNFDTQALSQLQAQGAGNVTITVKPTTATGVRNAYDVTLSTVKDGKTVNITSLGNGSAALSIPTKLSKNEAEGYLYAVYVDAKGNLNRIADSFYDANSGRVIFSTNHFSVYGVGYTAPSAKFTDAEKHWAKESIDYVVGRGLFGGNAEGKFSPDTAITRGEFVTALGRLAGVDTKAYTISSFTDVKADSYCLPYIEWAYSKGIIQGVVGNQFTPDGAITRQEIAVILQNYAKATDYILPITRTAVTFADAEEIGRAYAKAITVMQQAGIMMGKQNNKFNPTLTTTRAEASAMLHRYIKLTIEPATAQGWAKNDDGQYLYYKDGKAVTGTQTIDNVKYFFNTDGTLKTGWVKDDAGNWHFYSGNQILVGFWDLDTNGSNKRYYFDTYGNMIAGKWLQIDGKWYYFYADGSLARITKVDGYEVDENGIRKTT